jgi:hypothetical protein
LYNNKEDYKKSGFKMISNEDPTGRKASKHIFACLTLNTATVGMMHNLGFLYTPFTAAFMAF